YCSPQPSQCRDRTARRRPLCARRANETWTQNQAASCRIHYTFRSIRRSSTDSFRRDKRTTNLTPISQPALLPLLQIAQKSKPAKNSIANERFFQLRSKPREPVD